MLSEIQKDKMPRISLFLLFACIVTLPACKTTRLAPHSYTGKLVINGGCNNYVVQFIGSDPVGDKAEANWTDTTGGQSITYPNVFTVKNRCSFALAGLKTGDIFTFEITDDQAEADCFVCQIYVHTPDINNNVVNIQKIK